MALELWITFTLASAVLLAIPGPTVMLVVAEGIGAGKRAAMAMVPGVALGDLTAMSISLAGAGALLATSATAFTVLKFAGAAYLIWLGVKLWRNPAQKLDTPKPRSAARGFRDAYVVTALNPKSIVFFVAFVPQFIDPAAAFLPQVIVMVTTFVLLASLNVALWALLAGEMRARIGRPSVLKWMSRAGASFMIGAGILTALARRT